MAGAKHRSRPASKSGLVRARVDPALKVRVDEILGGLGLNASDAIRLLYGQIAEHGDLPFPVKIPNATTTKALSDADAGLNLTHYASVDEMFEDMGL